MKSRAITKYLIVSLGITTILLTGCVTSIAPRPDNLKFPAAEKYEPKEVEDTAPPQQEETPVMETPEQEEAPAAPMATSKYIYTVSHDGTLKKSLIESGETVWTSDKHGSWIASMTMDSKGFLYTSGGDDTIRKIDPADGSIIWKFTGHTADINEVFAVPHQDFIYSGDSNMNVKKISTEGKEIWGFKESGPIHAITADKNGNLFTGTKGGSIRKVDTQGNSLWTYQAVHLVEMITDDAGCVYAVGGNGNGVLKLSAKGEKVWNYMGHEGNVTFVTFGVDGMLYTADNQGVIKKLDPMTGTVLNEYVKIPDILYGLAQDHDGKVYAGTKSGMLYCLDLDNNEILWSKKIHSAHIREVMLSGESAYNETMISADGEDSSVDTEDAGTNEEAPTQYALGDTGPAGGLIGFINPDTHSDWKYIEIAPANWAGTDKDPKYTWGLRGKKNPELRGGELGTGLFSTMRIIELLPLEERENNAAWICANLNFGGYDDWFLPSQDELFHIAVNLGMNGLGQFQDGVYLTSTERASLDARSVNMQTGVFRAAAKTGMIYVRPIRVF